MLTHGLLALAEPRVRGVAVQGVDDAVTAEALLALPLSSLTAERLAELDADLKALHDQRAIFERMSAEQMWENDLAAFLELWDREVANDTTRSAAAAAAGAVAAVAAGRAEDASTPRKRGKAKQ